MKTVRIWESRAPAARGDGLADIPTLTFVRDPMPGEKRPTIIVCPGGGYGSLAQHEAEPIAEWLEAIGICGVVLRYRLGPGYRHPVQLDDALRAIRYCRSKVAELGIDPVRIGILGFSAGGHLASTVATHWDLGAPESSDNIELASSRPDVCILVYPVVRLSPPYGHAGSRENLLGKTMLPELLGSLDNDLHVNSETPPTLLIHARDDEPVPVQHSLLYATALADHKVPFAMHLPEHGSHGFGLGNPGSEQDWRGIAEKWLRKRGF